MDLWQISALSILPTVPQLLSTFYLPHFTVSERRWQNEANTTKKQRKSKQPQQCYGSVIAVLKSERFAVAVNSSKIWLWVKCGIVEGKMRNGNCGTLVIGPAVRPRDRSYYAVYRTPHVAGAAVNCVMRVWKVAFFILCMLLSFAAKCV